MRLLFTSLFFIFIHNFSLAQSISDVSPNQANQGDQLEITIIGENTEWAQGTHVLLFKQGSTTIYPNPQTTVNDTEIKGYFYFYSSHPVGDYDVSVEDWVNGTEEVLEDGFNLLSGPQPEIVSIIPDSAEQVSAVTVTVTGENVDFEQSSSVLKFLKDGGVAIYPLSISYPVDSVIEADFVFNPSHPAGLYDAVVTSYNETIVVEDGFEVLPATLFPEITSVDPDHADRGASLWVTISGENTYFTMGTATIKFVQGSSTIYPTTENVLSDTLIEGDFTFDLSHPVGFYDVFVYDIHGSWSVSKEEGFYLYEETAIEDVHYGEPGRIYPNPASNKVFIERNAHNRKGIAIDILDMSGKTVRLAEMTSSEQLVEIDISDFEKGIYLVKLRCGDKISIKKLVVR